MCISRCMNHFDVITHAVLNKNSVINTDKWWQGNALKTYIINALFLIIRKILYFQILNIHKMNQTRHNFKCDMCQITLPLKSE